MKWSFFHKNTKQNKREQYKQHSCEPTVAEHPKPSKPDTVPGVKEGYYVDRFYSYGEDVDFVNEKKGVRKPIIREHAFVDFPGVDEAVEEGKKYNKFSNGSFADWMHYVERTPINARLHYRVEFSQPNEQGQTRILWMLQPHDTPDDDGFGMGDTPEIMLATMLDDNGNYII
ncbi:MAG: hypothetical protein LUG27_09275 [Clostridiales bacterium]|nr:hypothetical protein [Clostridiales bacterium]